MTRVSLLLLALLCVPCASTFAKDDKAKKKPEAKKPALDENAMTYASKFHWADWVEPDFPFFSSVLDARDVGEGFPKDNLTPRGLILNLGHNVWACFDTDLLRIACIWEGEPGRPPVTPSSLAPGSYHIAGQKTKDGQDDLPKPVGKVWLANGIYPGWQVGEKPSFTDPREPGTDKDEVGRGAISEGSRFLGICRTKLGVCLKYQVGKVAINEWLMADEQTPGMPFVVRRFEVSPCNDPMMLLAFACPASVRAEGILQGASGPTDLVAVTHVNDDTIVSIKPHNEPLFFSAHAVNHHHTTKGKALFGEVDEQSDRAEPASLAWPQSVTTKAALSTKEDAYVVDDIPLPLENPWQRNVRLADLAFLNDQGDAAAVTMDGDVWLISGLKGDLTEVKWRRFASGLHEPMSVVWRPGAAGDGRSKMEDGAGKSNPSAISQLPSAGAALSGGDLFVFDRNGIWKLIDSNNDGECDRYEMFCNLFAQTAETREFPNSMKLAPDGSLVISKGGQQGTTLGKHNGMAIRVAADGKSFEVIGYGLRQPFLGVHPKTGMVVASDQEGNYVPTTPIQIIKDHQFYGHLATIQPHEDYPQSIADPLTWIPHSVVPSGATLTWLTDAKMGAINDELVLVSYNKPELHRVLVSNRGGKPQAAVVPWIKNFDFPTLNAHMNPADGQLYTIGFQVWGTTVKRISGLARIRYTGKPRVLLTECTPCDKGVLLRFNLPLDKAAATNLDNYNVERWNYKRTFNYGSPHLKQDGSPGQEWMVPSSAYLSKDGTSVFIGLPDMKAGVMQMRVGYGLKGAEGLPAQNNAYFTPHELITFVPEMEGFDKLTVDLTPRKMAVAAATKPTLEEGKRIYEMMGCMACHSTDGTTYAKVGPSWKGLYGSERLLAKGGDKAVANEAYLKESIQNPPAKVVKGYEKLDAGMPIYAGVLSDSQIESLILFIKSVK